MSDVSLDHSGKLDDPDYISGLSKGERARLSRRNVFAFSLSVASHEVLQLVGLITGHQRIGGTGPRSYDAYPAVMELLAVRSCDPDCAFAELTASAQAVEPRPPAIEVAKQTAPKLVPDWYPEHPTATAHGGAGGLLRTVAPLNAKAPRVRGFWCRRRRRCHRHRRRIAGAGFEPATFGL